MEEIGQVWKNAKEQLVIQQQEMKKVSTWEGGRELLNLFNLFTAPCREKTGELTSRRSERTESPSRN